MLRPRKLYSNKVFQSKVFSLVWQENFKISKFQNFKISKFQNFKISKFQNFKISKFQNFKISKFQNFKISKFQNFKISKFQNFKISKFLQNFVRILLNCIFPCAEALSFPSSYDASEETQNFRNKKSLIWNNFLCWDRKFRVSREALLFVFKTCDETHNIVETSVSFNAIFV